MYRKWIACSLPLLLAACSGMQKPTAAVNVPHRLKPEPQESLAMIVAAKGVQVYECRAKADRAGEYGWAFVAPEADLFDGNGRKIGTHYAGPHWESADGSKVIGRVKDSAAAPRADAIPWLLLTTKSVSSRGSFQRYDEHPTRQYGRRSRAGKRLLATERRDDSARALRRGLLLPQREVKIAPAFSR